MVINAREINNFEWRRCCGLRSRACRLDDVAMSFDHYCTYFDHRYAAQGLAMIRSLRAHGGDGPVWVLCLSGEAERLVSQWALGDLRIVSLDAVESHFDQLSDARQDRSLIEYFFTLTPHIVRYVFDHAAEARRVAYLDGDLFFFGPVAEMWEAASAAPAAIIPHRFNPRAAHLCKYGNYNVGWVSFSRSTQGLECLDFWQRSCRAWCRDQPDGGRFADQGYLDQFADFAPDLAIIDHKGCNLGPWNVASDAIRVEDRIVTVGGDRLIFFHFTGFRKGLAGRWYNSHRLYRAGTNNVVRDCVYRPYLKALMDARATRDAQMRQVDTAPDGAALARNRGGGVPLKARLYKRAQLIFQLLDWLTGKSLAEPAGIDRTTVATRL